MHTNNQNQIDRKVIEELFFVTIRKYSVSSDLISTPNTGKRVEERLSAAGVQIYPSPVVFNLLGIDYAGGR